MWFLIPTLYLNFKFFHDFGQFIGQIRKLILVAASSMAAGTEVMFELISS